MLTQANQCFSAMEAGGDIERTWRDVFGSKYKYGKTSAYHFKKWAGLVGLEKLKFDTFVPKLTLKRVSFSKPLYIIYATNNLIFLQRLVRTTFTNGNQQRLPLRFLAYKNVRCTILIAWIPHRVPPREENMPKTMTQTVMCKSCLSCLV